MKKTVGVTTFLLASVAALNAHADLLSWAPGIGYAQGVKPVIALGTTNFGEWAIEVHQGQAGAGTLWYQAGKATGTGLPVLGSPQSFDYGFAPSVATLNDSRWSPNTPSIVEVHQQGTGPGPLWYSIGSMANIWAPSTITWTAPSSYDWGYAPSVAALAGTVVEVHQGQQGFGPMWYHVGTVSGASINWGPSYQYDSGVAPQVAITTLPGGSPIVVEVHQGSAGFGSLWYRTGTISGNTIAWTSSAPYDTGLAPTIAADQSRVIEVHEGTANSSGLLWYHVGAIAGVGSTSSPGGIAWDINAHSYTTGYAPSVAFDPVSAQGYELHQQASGMGTLIAQIFSTQPIVPLYPQVEDDWCWLNTAVMTMETLRHDVKNDLNNSVGNYENARELQCEAANAVQAGGSGYDCCADVGASASPCDHGGDYATVLNAYGFSHQDYGGPVSFATLQNEMANGRPVPIGIVYPWNAGHAVVISGTEVDEAGGQWIVINDGLDMDTGTQWINPYSNLTNTNLSNGWIVTELSINVKAP